MIDRDMTENNTENAKPEQLEAERLLERPFVVLTGCFWSERSRRFRLLPCERYESLQTARERIISCGGEPVDGDEETAALWQYPDGAYWRIYQVGTPSKEEMSPVDRIYYRLEDWLSEKQFEPCDVLLSTMEIESIPSDRLLAMLKITFPARPELPTWNRFYARAREVMIQRGDSIQEFEGLGGG